jgi:AcrR family transcriptional regulator
MAVASRMTRAERADRNRRRVLAAAREVFLARGYHAATVEQIADAAGFSTGVVYSQFDGKADLFLALLEARIEERIHDQATFVERLEDAEVVGQLIEHARRVTQAEPEWGLLVLEFRVHAARHPDLNARYAEAHARTVAGLAKTLTAAYARSRSVPGLAPEDLAEVIIAVASGSQLEVAAGRDALAGPLLHDVMKRIVT